MLSRRTFFVASSAVLLAGCSLPPEPQVAFEVEPAAVGSVLHTFQDYAHRYGYKPRQGLSLTDIFGSDAEGDASYRAWRSEFEIRRWIGEPAKYVVLFSSHGLLGLNYQDLLDIAVRLKEALSAVEGVLIDDSNSYP